MNPYIIPALNLFEINVQLRMYKTSDQVLFKVAEYYFKNGNINIGEDMDVNSIIALLKSKIRKKEIVQARFAAAYFIHDIMNISLKSIGKILGGRDHSSIIHAKDTYENNVEIYKEEQSHHLALCELLVVENKIKFK